jgi:hypothetical protein
VCVAFVFCCSSCDSCGSLYCGIVSFVFLATVM